MDPAGAGESVCETDSRSGKGETMNKTPESDSVKRAIISKLLLLAAVCMLFAGSVNVQAAKKVTVYNGVDYAKVYNFDYYVSHFSIVKKRYANNPSAAFRWE